MHRIVVVLVALSLLAAGCGGGVGTESSGNTTPGPGSPDPDPPPPTPGTEPAQLHVTRFDAVAADTADEYEPNDTQPLYLGPYGYQYTVTDAKISPSDLTYTVGVQNAGAPVTTPFTVEFFRDAPSAPANQVGDLRQEIPALATGETAEVVFQVTDAEPGTRLSWAVADGSGTVPETDESDNVSSGLAATVTPDVDLFSVFQTAGYPVQVQLDQLPADYDVQLLNSAGTVLASSANDGTASESFSYTVSANGTYLVKVFGYAGARSAQPYRLRVTVP